MLRNGKVHVATPLSDTGTFNITFKKINKLLDFFPQNFAWYCLMKPSTLESVHPIFLPNLDNSIIRH